MKIAQFLLPLLLIVTACDNKPNDHFIKIHDKQQHVLTWGKGEPVVVFLTGGGSDLKDFEEVQKAIAEVTKTFLYDKPGLGKSELINSPRTLPNVTEELKELLDKEGIIDVPMIFVGHSMGGDIARYFLHVYPENVVGIVLIDPGSEYLTSELNKNKTGKALAMEDSLLEEQLKAVPPGFQMEVRAYPQHDSLLKTFEIKTNIPITLLESTKLESNGLSEIEQIEIQKKLYRNFQRKVPQTKIISTDKSGHFIQLEEPGLVIGAIKEMVAAVR